MDNRKTSSPYWEARFNRYAVKILPGEYYACAGDEVIVTVLGSCISACIYDSVMRVGGMNHFMLPEELEYSDAKALEIRNDAARYGNIAMKRLINEVLKLGGSKCNMQAKIFGGGHVTNALVDIGAKNIDFARKYLKNEGIPIVKEDVGSDFSRKVYYIPSSNEVYVKRISKTNAEKVLNSENHYLSCLDKETIEMGIGLSTEGELR